MEELESEEVEYELVEEFLTSLKKKFREGEEFKRTARRSGYEGRLLVEEFKRGMNRVIKRKLMEAENQPGSIEKCNRRVIALDRNWRESRREEERLKGKKEQGRGAPKQEQKQIMP